MRYCRLFFRAIFSARFSAFDLRGFFLIFFFLSCPFAMGEESIPKRLRFLQKPGRGKGGTDEVPQHLGPHGVQRDAFGVLPSPSAWSSTCVCNGPTIGESAPVRRIAHVVSFEFIARARNLSLVAGRRLMLARIKILATGHGYRRQTSTGEGVREHGRDLSPEPPSFTDTAQTPRTSTHPQWDRTHTPRTAPAAPCHPGTGGSGARLHRRCRASRRR